MNDRQNKKVRILCFLCTVIRHKSSDQHESTSSRMVNSDENLPALRSTHLKSRKWDVETGFVANRAVWRLMFDGLSKVGKTRPLF